MNLAPSVQLALPEPPTARRSLRLAVVCETYPPEVNGVAATIERAVHGLRMRNHFVQLVRPRQHRRDAAANSEGLQEVLVRGMQIPMYSSLRMGLPSEKALLELWSIRRPDLVHVATEGPLGWSALQAARRLGLPVSSDFRTNFHAYSRHYGAGWLHKPILAYLRKFHNHAQCTMVPTEALRQSLSGSGFRNLRVLARGVDTALFDPRRRSDELRRSWGATPDALVALHVGRLAPEKNLPAVAAAYRQMQRISPASKLVVVGDGPASGELRARCPDAVFAGMRRHQDLATHYASGDVFLFPSLTETYGNVTLEAMASGLAVVAYDYAAASQLIRSGENGVLVPLDDPSGFARSAAALARQPALSRALGARARPTALNHGWDRIAGQLESVLLGLVDGSALSRASTVTDTPLQPC
jgi:glycosyltransferase involved in cell wall biosynthesis